MKIEQLFKNWDNVRSLLREMGLSWERIEVVMLLMKMNLFYRGPVTPSARWLAAMSGCNEKTVDRLVAWLKSEGLARVSRTRRQDGYYSVNELDLGEFLRRLVKLLGPALRYPGAKLIIRRVRDSVSVKGWFPKSGNVWQEWDTFFRLPTGRTSLLWRNLWV